MDSIALPDPSGDPPAETLQADAHFVQAEMSGTISEHAPPVVPRSEKLILLRFREERLAAKFADRAALWVSVVSAATYSRLTVRVDSRR